jgi:hypothetical protein
VEVRTQFVLPFDQTSLFPRIPLDNILEIEFYLSLYLHIPYFDNLDYYQFLWKYERLNRHFKEKEEANKNQ